MLYLWSITMWWYMYNIKILFEIKLFKSIKPFRSVVCALNICVNHTHRTDPPWFNSFLYKYFYLHLPCRIYLSRICVRECSILLRHTDSSQVGDWWEISTMWEPSFSIPMPRGYYIIVLPSSWAHSHHNLQKTSWFGNVWDMHQSSLTLLLENIHNFLSGCQIIMLNGTYITFQNFIFTITEGLLWI